VRRRRKRGKKEEQGGQENNVRAKGEGCLRVCVSVGGGCSPTGEGEGRKRGHLFPEENHAQPEKGLKIRLYIREIPLKGGIKDMD